MYFKKEYPEKHFSCDTACQFSPLQDMPCSSYLKKLTNDDKYISLQDTHVIYPTKCVSSKSF